MLSRGKIFLSRALTQIGPIPDGKWGERKSPRGTNLEGDKEKYVNNSQKILCMHKWSWLCLFSIPSQRDPSALQPSRTKKHRIHFSSVNVPSSGFLWRKYLQQNYYKLVVLLLSIGSTWRKEIFNFKLFFFLLSHYEGFVPALLERRN